LSLEIGLKLWTYETFHNCTSIVANVVTLGGC